MNRSLRRSQSAKQMAVSGPNESVDNRGKVAWHLRWQGDWCRRLGSPLYGNLLDGAAADVELGGPCATALEPHAQDSHGSALALRFMGAVHRLVLEGRAPQLARHYPSAGGTPDPATLWSDFLATVKQSMDSLPDLIELTVQTNEVGRAAALLGGWLSIARACGGLPVCALELGASAGLLMRWDHYRYEHRSGGWGDPASPVRLHHPWLGHAPDLSFNVDVAERRGCDLNPLDPTTETGRITLESYLWADQLERLTRLRAAIEVARRVPAVVDEADAPGWLAEQLTRRRRRAVTVVYHTIVVQYLSDAARAGVERLIHEAGGRASPDAPVAWLRMEPAGDAADVRLTIWPDGDEKLIARSGYHGADIDWYG
jgi:hypothetical protein